MIKCADQQKVFLFKWIQQITLRQKPSNLNVSNITNLYFKDLGGINYISSFTIKHDEITFPSCIPRFWKDAVRSLLVLKERENADMPLGEMDILQEPLFNNKNIKYRGSTLFFKEWVKRGITHVFHLLENGHFMTMAQLSIKIGVYGAFIFDFNAIWNAIPHMWKQLLSSMNMDDIDNDSLSERSGEIDSSVKKINTNKLIRRILTNDTSSICGRGFWKNKMDVDIIDRFLIAFESTKEARLRVLHFKILHNILPTNILLKKMGIKTSELCDFCGELEVIEHMLIYCPKLRGFWEMVFNIIFIRTKLRIERSNANILFGINRDSISGSQKHYRIINHIILIAKMCISKSRAANTNRVNFYFESELAAREEYLS